VINLKTAKVARANHSAIASGARRRGDRVGNTEDGACCDGSGPLMAHRVC
jgi:hypothetical protein